MDKKLLKDLKSQLEKEGIIENEYVIIVYKIKPSQINPLIKLKNVILLYQNLKELEKKYDKDIININENNGLFIEWRTFD